MTDESGVDEADAVTPPVETAIEAPPKERKASPVWLVALPLAALLVVFGLWTLSKDIDEPRKAPAATAKAKESRPSAGADPTLEAIAIQQSDLPEPSIRCDFSGDLDQYVQNLKDARSPSYESVVQTWSQLKEKGATAGYIAYWGDVQTACDSVISPSSSMDHSAAKHPFIAFSFVVRYKDQATAEAAYRSDIFGQSTLKANRSYQATEGDATGLGPNSVVAITPNSSSALRQAIWQNRTVTVYFGSERIPLDNSKQIPENVNRRIT